jgi:hypothetical protein
MMLALTVKPPWAWATFHAGRTVDNTSQPWPKRWPLPKRLLIHASKRFHADDYVFGGSCIWALSGRELPPINELPCGAILGAVTVTGCVTESADPWFAGPYGLTLENPVLLPAPIECRGQLGLWPVEGALEEAVRAAAKGAA